MTHLILRLTYIYTHVNGRLGWCLTTEMSHVTHTNETHIQMSHSYHSTSDMIYVTYEWVMSHMNESCHVWMSHVTYAWVMSHMNESCHVWMSNAIYEWGMSHMNESCHICMSHVTYGWVMTHMYESWHIWMSHITYEWVTSHMDESCHIRTSHVTHAWVMSHMNESCHMWMVDWGDASWQKWVMSYIQISPATCIDELCHTYKWVPLHLWMSHATHTN